MGRAIIDQHLEHSAKNKKSGTSKVKIKSVRKIKHHDDEIKEE